MFEDFKDFKLEDWLGFSFGFTLFFGFFGFLIYGIVISQLDFGHKILGIIFLLMIMYSMTFGRMERRNKIKAKYDCMAEAIKKGQ